MNEKQFQQQIRDLSIIRGWLDSLKKTKAEVYVWRPVIFNEIVEILR